MRLEGLGIEPFDKDSCSGGASKQSPRPSGFYCRYASSPWSSTTNSTYKIDQRLDPTLSSQQGGNNG